MFSIDRRRVLTSSLGAFLLSWLPSSLTSAVMSPRQVSRANIELVARDLFRDRDAACAVGERALALHPRQADPAPLLEELEGLDRPEDIRATLSQRRLADFACGDSLVVDGWVMARSEAQLCALVSLGEGIRS